MTEPKPDLPWEKKRDLAKAIRNTLVERFPQCFKGPGEPKPPLVIGIRAEIAARCPDLSWGDLGIALFDYTRGPTYLREFVPGAQRIDLDGNMVGELTEADLTNAKIRLKAMAIAIDRSQDKRQAAKAHAALHSAKAIEATASDA